MINCETVLIFFSWNKFIASSEIILIEWILKDPEQRHDAPNLCYYFSFLYDIPPMWLP